jgi:hypothetical protein
VQTCSTSKPLWPSLVLSADNISRLCTVLRCAVLWVQLLVVLPENMRNSFAHLYEDPRAIVEGLLRRGEFALVSKIWPTFQSYRGLGATDPYDHVLHFATQLLSLKSEELGVGRDVGFACFDLALQYSKHAKVAAACVNVINLLSTALVENSHVFLIVDIMHQTLDYFKKNVSSHDAYTTHHTHAHGHSLGAMF